MWGRVALKPVSIILRGLGEDAGTSLVKVSPSSLLFLDEEVSSVRDNDAISQLFIISDK